MRWYLLLAALLLFTAIPASAAVTYDAKGSNACNNPATTCDVNITVGAGSNVVIMAGSAVNNGSVTVSSVACNSGVTCSCSLTKRQVNATSNTAEIWVCTVGTVGSNTASVVRFTYGSGTNSTVGAVSFQGVDQTTPNGTGVGNTGNDTTPTVTVSNSSGNISMDVTATSGAVPGSPTQTSSCGGAACWATGNNNAGGSSASTTASSNAHTWTLGSSQVWASVAVSVLASGGGGGGGIVCPLVGGCLVDFGLQRGGLVK